MKVTQRVKKCRNSKCKWQRYSMPISLKHVSDCVAVPVQYLHNVIYVFMFVCFQPNNHRNYTAIFSRRTGNQFVFALLCHIRFTQLLYGLPRFLIFICLFVVVLVFVRFSHCNFLFLYHFRFTNCDNSRFCTRGTKCNNSGFHLCFCYENSSDLHEWYTWSILTTVRRARCGVLSHLFVITKHHTALTALKCEHYQE